MISQITEAINAGQEAVTTVSSITPSSIANTVIAGGIIVVGAAVVLEVLNQCLGIDVIKEIKDWIMKQYNRLKKKFFDGPIDENSRIGKIIKFIKKYYKIIKGYISDIKTWINDALKQIQEVIDWVDAKIQKIREWINNPCVRSALAVLPSDAQTSFGAISNAVPGNISTPLPTSV